MIATLFLSTLIALSSSGVLAQDQTTFAQNANTLVGTWVSQSQGVITGPSFANPLNFSFAYGNTTGVSYSFTADFHFEEAWYKFTGNGSNPNCVKGVIQWQHGTYQPLANGTLLLNPIASDGRQQVQDTCAAVSNIIQQFNSTERMQTWEIRTDPVLGQELLLYAFDLQPEQPLYMYANPPIMLPVEQLTPNVTVGQLAGSGALPGVRISLALLGSLSALSLAAVLLS